jgi:cobalt-zinc-cadmium efflux system outer membrane protein
MFSGSLGSFLSFVLRSAVCSALLLFLPSAWLSSDLLLAQTVSLEHVLELARDRAPAIAAARARVVQAEGRRISASVPPDPTLRFGRARGTPIPRDGGKTDSESTIEVEQALPSPRSSLAWSRWGAAEIAAANDEVDVVRADVVLEAKRLYYEAAITDAEASALAEAARDAGSLRDVMERRVKLGEAREGDRLRTRVEALRTELEARAARARAEGERAALDRFLLGALGARFTLSTELDPSRLTETPSDAVAAAVSGNPEYRAALRRIEAARWAVSAQRALRFPGLSFSFFNAREIDRKASGLTLGLTVPLWNRNEGAVREAVGERAELESEALGLKATIEARAERLVRRDRVSRELAVSYRGEILPAAAEALSIARFSLEQGEANLLAWLEARRSYLEILRASYEAQRDAFLRRAELDRLLGRIDAQN